MASTLTYVRTRATASGDWMVEVARNSESYVIGCFDFEGQTDPVAREESALRFGCRAARELRLPLDAVSWGKANRSGWPMLHVGCYAGPPQ